MNIGSLIRGLLGDSKPGEAKSLELKEGQIVRGVVLSVSDSGKEAVVQIQGTPVRAELETPLQPGQTMNLQVAAPGEGGLPVLKPVSLGEAALVSQQSMGEALESLGLTDSKAGREIVQAMQSGGLALTKETAAKLDAVMNAKPAGVPVSQWLEAAVISVKRGLPVTAESVKGLQQAVFGPQLHQLLSALEEQLTVWAGQEAGKGGPAAGAGESKLAAPQAGIVAGTGAGDAEAAATAGKSSGQAAGQAAAEENVTPRGAAVPTGTGSAGAQGGNEAVANAARTDAGGTAAAAPKNEAGGVSGVAEGSADEGAVLRGGNAAEPGAAKTAAAMGNAALNHSAGLTEDGAEQPQLAASRSGQAVGTGGAAEVSETLSAGESAGARTAGESAGIRSTAESGGTRNSGAAEAAGARTAGGTEAAGANNTGGAALLAKLQGVLGELRGVLPQLAVDPAAAQPQGSAAPPAGAAEQDSRAAAQPRGDAPAAAAQQQQGAALTHDTESWVGRVLKLLGAEHEQQAVRGGAGAAAETARSVAASAAAEARPGQAALLPAAQPGPAAVGGDSAADTLKGVLLQVMGSSEVPPAVKEAAGALVQQLTGQQLLLNTDRTAPFAQVTLFLPLQGPDGQETASVHIQSRRGRKGELDAANCRLWFDLDMKQLGQTLVDVQVVDRIVSLKLHNNTPWVLELLEQRRDEIKTAVESIGYQLSGLRTEPLPETTAAVESAVKSAGKLTDYVPDSYKGVDYRV